MREALGVVYLPGTARRDDLAPARGSELPPLAAGQWAAGKFVSNFLLISMTFWPVKPSLAARSEIALK